MKIIKLLTREVSDRVLVVFAIIAVLAFIFVVANSIYTTNYICNLIK